MLDTSWHEPMSRRVLPLQIIVGALVAGCVTALGIFASIPGPKQGAGLSADLMTWVAVGFAVVAVVARQVLLAVSTSQGKKAILLGTSRETVSAASQANVSQEWLKLPTEVRGFLTLYQQRTILGAAMLEGCAFFACIAFFLEHRPLALGVAVLLILGVASHFPTSSRVIGWIEQQMAWLEQERQFTR